METLDFDFNGTIGQMTVGDTPLQFITLPNVLIALTICAVAILAIRRRRKNDS